MQGLGRVEDVAQGRVTRGIEGSKARDVPLV